MKSFDSTLPNLAPLLVGFVCTANGLGRVPTTSGPLAESTVRRHIATGGDHYCRTHLIVVGSRPVIQRLAFWVVVPYSPSPTTIPTSRGGGISVQTVDNNHIPERWPDLILLPSVYVATLPISTITYDDMCQLPVTLVWTLAHVAVVLPAWRFPTVPTHPPEPQNVDTSPTTGFYAAKPVLCTGVLASHSNRRIGVALPPVFGIRPEHGDGDAHSTRAPTPYGESSRLRCLPSNYGTNPATPRTIRSHACNIYHDARHSGSVQH